MEDTLLTTRDNPFDPFTQFEAWNQYDQRAGYFTLSLVARLVNDSDEFSEALQSDAIDEAYDTIISEDPRDVYMIVKRNQVGT